MSFYPKINDWSNIMKKQRRIKLSIVIPVFNVELYLEECLDSLVYNIQKYSNEIEVILIDDGSTDGSYQICKKYEAKYSFIQLLRQKNLGQSAARNNAINKAKGKWISFIDSDDLVINNYASILLDIINNCTDNSDIVMFKYKSFKKIFSNYEQNQKHFEKNKLKKIDKNDAMYLLTALNYWGNFLWNKIYKKEILLTNLLPVGKKYEDIGTLYKYVFNSKQIYIYDDILYYYRQREGSTVHIRSERIEIDEFEARKNQLAFFKAHNYLRAFKRAQYYFVDSCLGFISDFPGGKLYYRSLKCVKSYDVTIKNDGFKMWIKVLIVKSNPKAWFFIKKII